MIHNDLLVSVVAPLRNDVDILEPFVVETASVLASHYANYEFLLIEDASVDGTFDAASRLLECFPGLRLIRLSRHFGQEIAISAGLDSVIGDFVVVMLPETDPPQLIPAMVNRCREGAGIVFGIRSQRTHEPRWLRWGAGAFYWACARLLGMTLPSHSTHFRVLSRQALNAIVKIKSPSRYLQTLSAYVGYGSQAFPYDLVQRRARPRRKTLVEAVRLAINIVVSNTTRPLHLASYGGLALSGLYLLYIGYTLLVYAFEPKVAEGWVTLSAQTAVAFFCLFLILAVMSEYLGSLLEQTRERPPYFVVEERNSMVMIADEERRNVVERSFDQDA